MAMLNNQMVNNIQQLFEKKTNHPTLLQDSAAGGLLEDINRMNDTWEGRGRSAEKPRGPRGFKKVCIFKASPFSWRSGTEIAAVLFKFKQVYSFMMFHLPRNSAKSVGLIIWFLLVLQSTLEMQTLAECGYCYTANVNANTATIHFWITFGHFLIDRG